jgi:small subunit ribosomal protein S16
LLKIRLARVGKRKQPSYRIVVTDSRNPRGGAHLEIVGHYNPLTNPATVAIKEERVVHWLGVGAQPSDTAAKILTKAGVMEQAGRTPVTWDGKPKAPGAKKAKAMEAAKAAAAAPAPAPAPAAQTATEEPAAAPAEDAPAAEPEPAPTEEAAAEEAPADTEETPATE